MDEPIYIAVPVTVKKFIHAPIEQVWERIADLAGYPKMMADVESVVIRQEGNQLVSDWDSQVDDVHLMWTEADDFFPGRYRTEFRLTQPPPDCDRFNDLDRFQGYWQLESVEGGTEIELFVDWDLDMPAMMKLIGPTLEKKIEENSIYMLECIRKACESETVCDTMEIPLQSP